MSQTFRNTDDLRAGPSRLGTLFAIWGLFGFLAALVNGIVKMMPVMADTLDHSLNGLEITSMAASIILFTVGKGYFVFQRSFSPRFGERARILQENPNVFYGLLAPFYCMGLLGSPLFQMLRTWLMTAVVVIMIITVRTLPAPWRGIILIGVVLALVWGVIATSISVFDKLARSRKVSVAEVQVESHSDTGISSR